MSNLKKIADEDRESKFGYVYAVSGPGKFDVYISRVHMSHDSVVAICMNAIEEIITLNF